MDMAEHSKAPWYVGSTGIHDLCGERYRQVHIYPADGIFGNAAADVQLIRRAPALLALAEHVLAMDGDAYLNGHPEWAEIIREAKDAIA